MATNDPLASKQAWYKNAIDLDRLGDEYSGAGIRIGIYDDGIQVNHADLAGNYDASLEVKISGVTASPLVGTHGTAVAGIIAGVADNGIGGYGIAYDSTITGVSIFGGAASGSGMISAIQQMAKFDLTNNSWNWTDIYADAVNAGFGKQFNAALELAVDTGRGGLGTLIVNSAGNDWVKDTRDANTSGFDATRFTITTGAVADNGFVSSYSNRGANILVSAPSSGGSKGVTTTDIEGAGGYTSGDSYDYFGGTSAAAPIVSSVVALMLEANGELGWRDIKEILALGAEHTGSALGDAKSRTEAFAWSINGSTEANGGGLHFSNDYGFGQVNAYNSVRIAEVYSLFGEAQASANERTTYASGTLNRAIPDGGTTSFNVNITQDISVEHVDLTLTLTHANVKDLLVELVSPDGTTSVVLTPGTGAAKAGSGFVWTFGSEQFLGEMSAGTWTVRITDTRTGSTGTVANYRLDVYGAAADADNVYTYTDEYAKMAAFEEGRTTLSDTDGGNDWINTAAVASDTVIDLRAGATSTIAGVATTLAAGTVIENAVTGDGDDTLTGNAADNQLHGMRGDDLIEGGAGADHIDGGTGTDTASYASSSAGVDIDLKRATQTGGDAEGDRLVSIENIIGSAHADILRGDSGHNVIEGGAGDDVLESHGGGDILDGGEGFDIASYEWATAGVTVNAVLKTVTGAGAGDVLLDIEGYRGTRFNDIFSGSGGHDWFDGGDGDDIFMGSVRGDTLIGGAGFDTINHGSSTAGVTMDMENGLGYGGFADGDVFSGIERVIGSRHADTFIGSAAIEQFDGGDGDDVFRGHLAGDTVNGGNGTDTLDFSGRDSSIYVDIATRKTADGTLFTSIEKFVGTDYNDYFYGTTGNEILIGGAGNDTIEGMAGADHMEGGDGGDTLVYRRSDAGVQVSLSTGVGTGGHAQGDTFDGFEHLIGSAFNDSLVGTTGKNNIWGGSGNDTIDGRGGGDWIFGEAGNDTIRSRAEGWGNNILDGGDGWDTVNYDLSLVDGLVINLDTGLTTNGVPQFSDTLVSIENVTGSNQADTITGSNGANILDGGRGDDILTGLGGYDTFRFTGPGFGNDTVCDFQDGVDRIAFVGNAKGFGDLAFEDLEDACVITVGGAGSITLAGMQSFMFSADDFTFA